ncbi:MAG: hypothetical protein E7A72_02530 [Actinomyces urogenitalis]|uniref:Uncharacterized protein n=3 Tax=Actinomyces urogenitalis TaxID=103621 RepID=C0W7M5_9ACTO|nr:hypothetical protein [Actinomyces urogenitalis]EEH65276.1 hypothetical protein HMPREF0058_1869 [Actinomyces urogenitalis DSM 15434]MBS5977017.1 hypothetical protein [Actinomyces urogenitalis]MDK8237021.1 hypothetical protein [Actinomyces urogenitalis]MDK8834257.1 hypothetical protein [Actinomyces urogenitalis]MDU0864920.1 hypothetical protein [Actinomyces urogenitalis]
MSTQTHRASGDHHVEIYDNPADSVGSWMIAILVTAIPVVGFIYLVVVAFGATSSPSRRNWARATFAWYIIGAVVAVVLGLILASTGLLAEALRS